MGMINMSGSMKYAQVVNVERLMHSLRSKETSSGQDRINEDETYTSEGN